MEFEWNSRPLSVTHRPPDWTERPEDEPRSSTSTSTYYSQRRRSSIAPVPPPGPPPSQPIPNLPFDSSSPSHEYFQDPTSPVYSPTLNSSDIPYNAYSRPAASTNLAAVATFAPSRTSPSPSYPQSDIPPTASSSSSPYNLSDSPPRSQLRSGAAPQHREIMPERLQLSPSDATSSNERRPSSRRALTRALELAREAVRLDSTNDDPYAAVAAYGRSVSLLSEVMERVRRGEESTESNRRRNGRRRSVVAQEEEVRRLRSIHDTYADRMNILSLIYSIPIDTLPSSAYHLSVSTSTDSTQPPSPSSGSPPETSENPPQPAISTEDLNENPQFLRRTANSNGIREHEDGTEAIGSAMFNLDVSNSSSGHEQTSSLTLPHTTPTMNGGHRTVVPMEAHSQVYTNGISSSHSRTATLPQSRGASVQMSLRSRASSTLPPLAPPPTNSLPPAPAPTVVERSEHLSFKVRASISHKRTGSGSRLGPLREEAERREENIPQAEEELRRPRSKSVLAAQRHYNDSQPLPPLPPQTGKTISPGTSRVKSTDQSTPPSPDSLQFAQTRPQGDSTMSAGSDAAIPPSFPPLVINNSPFNGTISLRRGKTSAPPSISASPDPESSQTSNASIPTMNRVTGQSVPVNTTPSMGTSRVRAVSQPGRRPSLSLVSGPRKVSIPSKLNPNAPPQITINTAQLTPSTATTATMLIPPPPILHETLPATPLSPLPSTPPSDPLRKPYHMMNLLRHTMVLNTGGYVTRRLHVPREVWSQGGAKLSNIPEKIRVVEVLLSALEEVHNCSVDIFGAGNVSSGLVLGIGSIGPKEGEAWGSRLEEFSAVCDSLVSNFGKKLCVGEGFVTKKSGGLNAWGNKLTRQFDKLTTGKNLDSPTIYVQGLAKLFHRTQLLDEHTKALSLIPVAPAYAAFSVEMRIALDAKLRHASEFFAKVVLTFVIRDLSQLLDKYVKKCEKWLAE